MIDRDHVPIVERRRSTIWRTAAIAGALTLAAACGGKSTAKAPAASTASTAPIPTEQVTPKPGPSVLLPSSHHREVEQFGASTFTDYQSASGVGPALPKGAIVDVDCLATGPVEAAPTARGKWYHLSGPAQVAGYWAAANTFENGDTSGPLSDQPAVDSSVPACP